MAHGAEPAEIEIGPLAGELVESRQVIFQAAGILEPAIGGEMEGPRAQGRAAAIQIDHDESELCQGLRGPPAGPGLEGGRGVEAEGFWRADQLRPRIEIIDYRVSVRRIEIRGLVEHAVEIRRPVGRLDGEAFGEGEALGKEIR